VQLPLLPNDETFQSFIRRLTWPERLELIVFIDKLNLQGRVQQQHDDHNISFSVIYEHRHVFSADWTLFSFKNACVIE
jgi:hypothetical protein